MIRDFKKVTATPSQVEAIYGIPRGSLANLRWQKAGPKFFKVGPRRILYRLTDVEEWIEAHSPRGKASRAKNEEADTVRMEH